MMNAMKNYSGNDKTELLEAVKTIEILGGHLTLNTIYTIEEYIKQGFTSEEAPKAKKSDELFNKWKINGELSDTEKEEYFALVEELGF
jgi:hypothetical protein